MSQNLRIHVASGEPLDVRAFNIEQEINTIFNVSVLVHSESADVSFDDVLGKPASFTMATKSGDHSWSGICSHIEQEHADDKGLSTYRLTVVPTLWLLTQRRNHRIFQQMSEVEIVQKLLGEWGITPKMQLTGEYKKRKYKVQYAESDFDFMSRMLEDTGISYYFEQQGSETQMVLNDGPHQNPPKGPAIPWNPKAGNTAAGDHISSAEFKQRVRPGKYTVQDHDYRKPATYSMKGTASAGLDTEANLERYHYNPGALLYRAEPGGESPVADDKGASRSDEKEAATQAARRLAAHRSEGKRVHFSSNAFQLTPGTVYSMSGHPRSDLGKAHLVVAANISGSIHGEWHLHGQSAAADEAFHPPIKTKKPKTQGVESATVVGAPGEEIHTDEFGRIRVQFHWDREGQHDDNSSCWIHVNQPWGGAGYGASNLPRVGQEVLVDFLGGDPDRPVVTGRVYTAQQTTPYKLPLNKTQSGWKSNSTGGGGGYNEIMMEDSQGKELFRTQAERDYQGLVKNDSTHTIGNDMTQQVGNNRSYSVGQSNNETVGKDENLTVKGKRAVSVMDQLAHWVQNDISTTSSQGNNFFETAKNFMSKADQHLFTSDTKIVLACGSSKITLTPEKIIIDGPLTYINPGEEQGE